MAGVALYKMDKKKVGTVELPSVITDAKVLPHLYNDAVRLHFAKKYEHRTSRCKTRSEVIGTGAKIYRQKGTGQARHGDAKAPIFVGGGKAHGPRPRFVKRTLNKKVKKLALASALSLLQREDRFFVVDMLGLDEYSTQSVSEMMKAFGLSQVVFINTEEDEKQRKFNRSVANKEGAKFLKPEGINVFDLLKYQNVVISQSALGKLNARLSTGEEKT